MASPMIPSRLSPTNAPRPHHAPSCPATFRLDEGPPAPCEGHEGHEGPHVARVTVTWADAPKPPEKETPDA